MTPLEIIVLCRFAEAGNLAGFHRHARLFGVTEKIQQDVWDNWPTYAQIARRFSK